MPIKDQQGNVTIRELDGLIQVSIRSFVISIQAIRRKGDAVFLEHKPMVAHSAANEEEARATGMKEALRIWSKADGWEGHDSITVPTTFTFDMPTRPPSS